MINKNIEMNMSICRISGISTGLAYLVYCPSCNNAAEIKFVNTYVSKQRPEVTNLCAWEVLCKFCEMEGNYHEEMDASDYTFESMTRHMLSVLGIEYCTISFPHSGSYLLMDSFLNMIPSMFVYSRLSVYNSMDIDMKTQFFGIM